MMPRIPAAIASSTASSRAAQPAPRKEDHAVSRSRTRLVGLVGAALLAIIAVAPASAYTPIIEQDPSDSYEIMDDDSHPAVRCVYEYAETNGQHRLDKIRIRGPKNFHHYTSAKNWVGWRYILKRDTDTSSDGPYYEEYRSPVYKARANDNTYPAQFSDRIWTAPEPNSQLRGNWKVWVVLFWFKPGSSTQVRSKHVLELDYYAVRGGGQDTSSDNARDNNCNGNN
jgi:hypothetical protein